MSDVLSCSPADDRYMTRKGKCKDCRACPHGTGRNLTKAKTKRETLDNTKCLPCEPCPRGTYNDLRGFTNECRPCTTNKCGNLYRNVQEQCSSTKDVICGSCKSGYHDCQKDVQLRCCKDPTEPPRPKSLPQENLRAVTKPPLNEQPPGNTNFLPYVLVVIGILSLILIFVGSIAIIFYRKKRLTCSQNQKESIESCIWSSSSLGSECSSLLGAIEAKNELEMDGPTDKPYVGEKIAHYDRVRGELVSVSIEQSTVGGRPVIPQNLEHECKTLYKKCGCCSLCHCRNACKNTVWDSKIVRKDDPLLDIISKSICHDFTNLFNRLNIPYADVFNLEMTRDRAPDKLSEHGYFRQVLERWVEREGRNALYGYLRQALCEEGFHRTNNLCFEWFEASDAES